MTLFSRDVQVWLGCSGAHRSGIVFWTINVIKMFAFVIPGATRNQTYGLMVRGIGETSTSPNARVFLAATADRPPLDRSAGFVSVQADLFCVTTWILTFCQSQNVPSEDGRVS